MKMKSFVTFIALVLMLGLVAAGQKRKPTPRPKPSAAPTPSATPTPSLGSLEDFELAKSDAGLFLKTLWSLSLHYQQDKYPAKTSIDLSAELDKSQTLDEHKELRPYRRELPLLTARIGVLGSSITYFLYGNGGPFPLRLVRYKQTKCFVVYVASSTVYNTLRLSTAKQRAAQEASSRAFPILREMARDFKDTDIETVAVFVTYGTKDFLDKSVSATKAEILAVIASKSDAQALASGELSDVELLRKAVTLLSDRDANSDFTKVELE